MQAKVPDEANRYWWKRLTPPLEFGAMHALLLQMAIIPLTMARHTLGALSNTFVQKFVPFNRVTDMHIWIGYTFCSVLFASTGFFFLFFGIMCQDQKDGYEPQGPLMTNTFCEKFVSEMMLTGYAILFTIILVFVTSYFRNRIPYEVFYLIHHFVFVMFALATLHTNDVNVREGIQQRSQTFKWYSATIIYYVMDRYFMHMCARQQIPIKYAAALGDQLTQGDGSNKIKANKDFGSHVVILKIKRPNTFQFRSGMYVFLQIDEIDIHWHPFSVASEPGADTLDFYIQVAAEDSWTDKLWHLVDKDTTKHQSNADNKENEDVAYSFKINVKGPYGSTVGDLEQHTNAIMVGTGTGVVPIVSYLRHFVGEMKALSPVAFIQAKVNSRKQRYYIQKDIVHQVSAFNYMFNWMRAYLPAFLLNSDSIEKNNSKYMAQLRAKHDQESRGGSFSHRTYYSACAIQLFYKKYSLVKFGDSSAAKKQVHTHHVRYYIMMVKSLLFCAIPLYLFHLQFLLVSFSLSTDLTRSGFQNGWNYLLWGSVIVLFIILIHVMRQPITRFFTLIDIGMLGVSCLTYFTWSVDVADTWILVTYVFISLYFGIRLWHDAVCDVVADLPPHVHQRLNTFRFVWSTRSADLILKIWPEIEEYYDQLVTAWSKESDESKAAGAERAVRVLKIRIHCTDTNKKACDALVQKVSDSLLYKSGALVFDRVDIVGTLTNHSEMLARTDRFDADCVNVYTKTLVGFCGHPHVGGVWDQNVHNQLIRQAMTGRDHHNIVFAQENYGHVAPPKNIKQTATTSSAVSAQEKGYLPIAGQGEGKIVELTDVKLNAA